MSNKRVLILGSSAYPEIAEIIRDMNIHDSKEQIEVIGILDDNEETHGTDNICLST